jgi:hypothetical protein
LIWEGGPDEAILGGCRIFIGGAGAADDADVLHANGIRAKMCFAGTEGGCSHDLL